MRNPGLRAALIAALVVAIGGSVAIALVGQWSRLPDVEWRLHPGWLAASFAGLVVFHWSHAEIWRRVVGTLGSGLDEVGAQAIWSVSLLGRYVPTSLLMPVIRVGMSATRGVPRRVSAASVVYELALTFTAAVVLGAWAIVQAPALDDGPWRVLLLAAPLAVFGVLHPRVLALIAHRLLARVSPGPLPTLAPRAMAGYAVLYAGGFVVAGLSVAAFAHALHPLDAGEVPVLVAAYPVGFAVSLVAFVAPAGLGAREAGLAAAASLAVPAGIAVAAAVGIRLLQIVVELVYAGVARWLMARRDSPSSPAMPAAEPAQSPRGDA